jgi:hypothetical protein
MNKKTMMLKRIGGDHRHDDNHHHRSRSAHGEPVNVAAAMFGESRREPTAHGGCRRHGARRYNVRAYVLMCVVDVDLGDTATTTTTTHVVTFTMTLMMMMMMMMEMMVVMQWTEESLSSSFRRRWPVHRAIRPHPHTEGQTMLRAVTRVRAAAGVPVRRMAGHSKWCAAWSSFVIMMNMSRHGRRVDD